MKTRLLIIPILASVLLILPLSCSTGGEGVVTENDVADAEYFLARPQLKRAVGRPLGRILIAWDPVDGATGYQLEMSTQEDFTLIEKSWTIKGGSLELPLEGRDRLWFRVRAFDGETSSRWSTTLEVSEETI